MEILIVMISSMDMEFKNGLMGHLMLETGNTESYRERGSSSMPVETFMKGNGSKVKPMAKVFLNGFTEGFMKDSGRKMNLMDMERNNGETETYIRGNIHQA
jgi:hypothetical protein